MRRLLLGLLFALFGTAAHATCPASLILQDAAGTQAPAQYLDNGSGLCMVVIDTNATGNLINTLKGPIPAGTNNIGNVGFAASPSFGATPGHVLSAATTNSTNIKASAGTLYSLTVLQTTAVFGDLRLYDTAGPPACNSASGVVANFPVPANTTSPGFSLNFGAAGMKFITGIGFCLTGAFSDSDNSNFVAGVAINWTFN